MKYLIGMWIFIGLGFGLMLWSWPKSTGRMIGDVLPGFWNRNDSRPDDPRPDLIDETFEEFGDRHD